MKKLLVNFFLFIALSSFSQTEDAWLFLKDKPNAASILENPLTILSQKALDRREIHTISLDEKDVPIHSAYYNQLKNEGNITILGKSKWLNAIHVQGTVSQINGLLPNFPFIASIEFANKSLNTSSKKREKRIASNHQHKFSEIKTDFNYGNSENQIKMLKGDYLHKWGLTGKDQIIAVIDAGFPNVNTLDAFKRIRDNNQILGGYNFADRNTNIYTRNSHGTHVLSTIAGYLEDAFVGTAPDAKFYLFISEIAETETVLEETLWVEAAERADSLGVNVINTSLGYTTYDNPNHSHSYSDMDGKTTFISRGAEIAASRGMFIVNSVGNSGNDSWKYLGAPADAANVISVGAVNVSGNIASFSSFGPTADDRIKPEILGQGAGTSVINFSTGAVVTSNGTSFSSPIMAGLIACLNGISYNTLKSTINYDYITTNLKESVFKSSDRFENPTDQYGYGIPDFEKALNIYLPLVASVDDFNMANLKVSPNPVTSNFSIVHLNDDFSSFSIQVFNILGKKVLSIPNLTSNKIDVSHLERGLYLLKVTRENQQKTIKLIKK